MLKKYKIGFDIWGLILFLVIMIPNFICFAIDRKNMIAVFPISVFTICHFIYGLVNFVV